MIYSPQQESEEKSETIHIINPSVKEFKTTYLNDKNEQIEVILAPLESRAFPRGEGEIVLRHLVNFILNEGGFSYKSDINLELTDIRKKCVIYE